MLCGAPFKDQSVNLYNHCRGMQERCCLALSLNQPMENDDVVPEHSMTSYIAADSAQDQIEGLKNFV